jgi:hypothetical protein
VLVFPLVPVPTGFAAAVIMAAMIGRRVVAECWPRGIEGVAVLPLRGA